MGYLGNEPADVAVTVGQGVIDASHIQDSSITTADLGNDAVTPNKIDDDGTGFQMGSLGLGGAVSGSDKLTVTGGGRFTGTVRIPHDTTNSFRIGASDDLALWHNGTDSAVTNVNTGKLYLWNYANSDTVIGSNNVESAVFSSANTTLRGTLDVAGTTTITGLTHLKGSAWNNILKLGDTSRSEQLTHMNNGSVNFSIYTSNGTKGVLTANHDGSAMTLGADYTSGTLTVYPPTTFTNHVTIDGATHPILKLVGDPSGESTHIQLHRSNGQGFTIYDDQASLRFRADLSGSNPQMLQLKSDKSATFFGNQLLNPSWATTNIAFGSATSGFSAYNTGARIEVPLHATNGQAHGSFKFYTNSGDSANYSMLLAESGDISAQKRFYVLGNHSGSFGTELYNASSTGHGLKVRGGSTDGQYSLFVSNYDQTATNFSISGNGDTYIHRGNLYKRHSSGSLMFSVANAGSSTADAKKGYLALYDNGVTLTQMYSGQIIQRNTADVNHLVRTGFHGKTLTTSYQDVFGFLTQNDHEGVYYEIIITGGDWGSHSAHRARLTGFINGSNTHNGHYAISNNTAWGSTQIQATWSGSTNARTCKLQMKITRASGSADSPAKIYYKFIGRQVDFYTY